MILAVDPAANPNNIGWAVLGGSLRLGEGALVDLPRIAREVIVEVPRIHKQTRGKDPNDLLDVALCAGSIIGAAAAWGARVYYAYPYEWKGNVPKTIHHRRMVGLMTEEERRGVDSLLDGYTHRVLSTKEPPRGNNAFDAYLLLKWWKALQEEEKKRYARAG